MALNPQRIMNFELDHLFIFTEIGAPAADRLVEFGFAEGSSNIHPGQGTTNRRFFFQNAMLELLWVHDPVEAQSELIQPTRLYDRWEQRDRVCPIGLILRSNPPDGAVAFSSWPYKPPYLPEHMSFAIATNKDVLTEAILFQSPFGQRPDQFPAEKAQPLVHPIGCREITRVTIVTPVPTPPSPEFQTLLNAQIVQLQHGDAYCVGLGFDGELQGQQVDLRPELPLIMSW
jgi:hypothetical protein